MKLLEVLEVLEDVEKMKFICYKLGCSIDEVLELASEYSGEDFSAIAARLHEQNSRTGAEEDPPKVEFDQ